MAAGSTSSAARPNAKVRITSLQRKAINRMAHDRARFFFPHWQYLKGFRLSQIFLDKLIKGLLESGFEFEEACELATDARVTASKEKEDRINAMRDELLKQR